MKNLIGLTFGTLLLVSCGRDEGNAFIAKENKDGCTISRIAEGTLIKCADGSETIVYDGTNGSNGSDGVDGSNGSNGQDGADGQDGKDGKDGETPLIHTKVKVAKNECKKVLDGIWVESINNGEFFDVYYNDSCKDSLGEFCDNVESSYGSSGKFGSQTKGSGSVCWANDIQISGSLDTDLDELTIHAISFK